MKMHNVGVAPRSLVHLCASTASKWRLCRQGRYSHRASQRRCAGSSVVAPQQRLGYTYSNAPPSGVLCLGGTVSGIANRFLLTLTTELRREIAAIKRVDGAMVERDIAARRCEASLGRRWAAMRD